MRVVFVGCVEFSFHALQRLFLEDCLDVVGIVTRESSSFNSDFIPLGPLAKQKGIPCFISKANDQELMGNWLRQLAPDIIYCFGWSYILNKEILQIPRLGVIGFHPAALPLNRGRHPIIWALVLGLQETASTFFFMDEGADSGDLLSQEFVPIEPSDEASDLYRKLTETALEQMSEFSRSLALNQFSRIPQDHSKANYWRKRSKADGQIDWRMSSKSIHNLVRGLAKPYVGAHCVFRGKDVKIWKAEEKPNKDDFVNFEPGKIVRVKNQHLVIKCSQGLIELIEHEFDPIPTAGSYL